MEENSDYKGPFNLGNLTVEEKVNDEALLKEASKSFENMNLCKKENGSFCGAISYTASLTGSECGSLGCGNSEAPAFKCTGCQSDAYDSTKKRKKSIGWY